MHDRQSRGVTVFLYVLAFLCVGIGVLIGLDQNARNDYKACADTATARAVELYQAAVSETDEELARHYKTLADSELASIDLVC